jgi:hypothetical protein
VHQIPSRPLERVDPRRRNELRAAIVGHPDLPLLQVDLLVMVWAEQ